MTGAGTKQVLDLTQRSPAVEPLIKKFASHIVGQEQATDKLVEIVESFLAGMSPDNRPAGSALFLGPTGTGKTCVVEAMAEAMFGDPRACLKVDCAEFQHSHEIAKLIGSPPGYLGHRETHALLTQSSLNQWHTPTLKLSIVLFDEIEKASDSLWQLLLGVLDKATLTLGDNTKTDFKNSIIVLTSNLGSKDMNALLRGGIGYKPDKIVVTEEKNASTALNAARKHFTPEFMNRLDYVATFNTLTKEQIKKVMAIEIGLLIRDMFDKASFLFQVTDKAKEKIMEEGYSDEYGARSLRRVLDKRLRLPMSRLVGTKQITPGSCIVVDEVGEEDFEFSVVSLKEVQIRFDDFSKGLL